VVNLGIDCMVPSLGALVAGPGAHLRGDEGPFGAVLFDGVMESLVLQHRPRSLFDLGSRYSVPSLAAIFIRAAGNGGSDLVPDQGPTGFLS
jgi:hypothetical protein